MAETVGFVGLGAMGGPMAARLAAAGYRVRGFDAQAQARERFARDAGVSAVMTPAAAADAPTVVLMLPSSDVVDAVMHEDGLLTAVERGTRVIDMGSSEPMRTRALAEALRARGATLLDAPVSGGVAGARAGTLTVMVGGPAADVAACRPLLEHLGATITHVGDTGAGHAVKALNNLLSATSLLVTVEALEVARRFGIDPQVAVETWNRSSGRSGSTDVKLPRHILPGTFDSGFRLDLMLKDMRIAGDLGRATGAPALLGEAAIAAWARAADALPGDADHTEIARWVDARER